MAVNVNDDNSVKVATSFENGKMVEKRTVDGKLFSITVFEDLNENGQYEENEITKVTEFYNWRDNSFTIKTYIDTDHDGYDDEIHTEEYDSNGDFTDKKCTKQKSINNETDPIKHNRKMTTHRDGNYMPTFNTIG